MIGGGTHTTEVHMRKRSENRGYPEENIRDSIVMGDVTNQFPDLGTFPSGFCTDFIDYENIPLVAPVGRCYVNAKITRTGKVTCRNAWT